MGARNSFRSAHNAFPTLAGNRRSRFYGSPGVAGESNLEFTFYNSQFAFREPR